MNNMTFIISIITITVISMWIFAGIQLYPLYRNSIYQELFGNFLSFFWHYYIRKDASQSGYLKTQIGYHKLLFSTLQQEGKSRVNYYVIFFQKGVLVFTFDKLKGSIIGNAKDKFWLVKRENNEAYKYQNPSSNLEIYLRRIVSVLPDTHIEVRIIYPDEVHFETLKSDITCIHTSDLIGELKNIKAKFLTDEQIFNNYHKLTGN